MEQITLSALMQHVQDDQMIRLSENGLMKTGSCLLILILFYDKVTCLMHEGKAVVLFTWTLVKHLTLCLTTFSWQNSGHGGVDTSLGKIVGWLGPKSGYEQS